MEILWVIIQFAIIGLIFYLLLYRPENKRRKALKAMQSGLSKGDRVVTTGGLRARVHAIEEGTVTLITDDGMKLCFERQAVVRRVD